MSERRNGILIVGIAVFFLAYFIVFPKPLEKEILFMPSWSRDLTSPTYQAATIAAGLGEDALPRAFMVGKRFGYFLQDGRILFSTLAEYDAAISDSAFASYLQVPEAVKVMSPANALLLEMSAPGYPFIKEGRFFQFAPDLSGMREYSKSGALDWARDFSSYVTSASVTKDSLAVGLLEGRMEILGNDGSVLSDFAPGGSRIPVILGCALSRDSEKLAIISGIDPQRLILLDRKQGGYRVSYHEYLKSSFTRTVPVSFSGDGNMVIFEQEGGIALLDCTTKKEAFISARGRLQAIESEEAENFFLVLMVAGGETSLVGIRPFDTVLLRRKFTGKDVFLSQRGNLIFLGVDTNLVRIDAVEG